ESTAAEQLNEVSDLITEVAGREIPRFIEHVALSSPQNGAETEEVDGTNGNGRDEWEDDSVDSDDPFDSPSSSRSMPTTGPSSEPSTDDDWLSDPDDPLA
ncbi:MAG: hypothetical protein VB861_00925, partial [Planctomycetaceae bacterium]